MTSIKFSKPSIQKQDLNLVKKIIKSGWLTHGKYTNLFENSFAKFTKSKYCITVSSCTAGLHLSCIASGFKAGDEVVVPSMTHTATAHAVEYTGARAVFADVEPLTGNLNLELIKKKITKKTKGIILVHMAGLPCDMTQIINFCKNKNIVLLEDCAHALGTKYKNKHVGNFGISGSFSFYPTKQITTGEGGMVITNNETFYKKIKILKAFGIDKDIADRKKQGDYDVKDLGFNFRMTDFQAALGYKQILSYKGNLKKRIILAKQYIDNFTSSKNIRFPKFSKNNSYFIFQIFIKNRDGILAALQKKNIGVSVHYSTPLPEMTYYKKKYKLIAGNYPNACAYADSNISLPVYPLLKKREVDLICKTIIDLTKNDS
jgi:perosamine synthetase